MASARDLEDRAQAPMLQDESSSLEIQVARRGVDEYKVDIRFTPAKDEAEFWFSGSKHIQFSAQVGTDAQIDPKAVGRQITEDLCSDPAIRSGLDKILAIANRSADSLHVRLFITPGAAELQLLPWETMVEPGTDQFLFAGERRSVSRFLTSSDFHRLEIRSDPIASAAVIIANPTTSAAKPFDVQAHVELAREALEGHTLVESVSAGSAGLEAIIEAVRSGTDVLYLVCHGSVVEGRPYLWLENQSGGVERVAVEDLIERLSELRARPRLIVLFSCRSGGDDRQFQGALGPRLAAIGVPAVLAMRGDVPIESAKEFLASFFSELRAHGSLDRAVAYARRAVSDPGSAWMPVLFSRLRSGRIWYRPGFVRTDGRSNLSERWDALVDNIANNKCTPILGPLLAEPLIGSSREIALHWSSQFGFPLAPQDRENLTSVAQYLATNQYANRPRELFVEHVRQEIASRFGSQLSLARNASPAALLEEAWKTYSSDKPSEPHRVLARLPFSRYLTTNTNLILEAALREVGKDPVSELYRWDDSFDPEDSIYARQPNYEPSVENPLVFHLFGHFDVPDSGPLLTEDDFFDYLINSSTNRDQLPPTVRRALYNAVLMFVGYQIDDWSFRVLFRSLINHHNRGNLRRFAHIAVQVDPEEGRILEPGRARRYLETYFERMGNISIFWGSAEEFMHELGKRWEDRQH